MSSSLLFTPLEINGLKLANRIVIPPMCQYSAADGEMTDWHLLHYGQLALSGAALLTIEATAVAPEGRISSRDVGLWSPATQKSFARVVDAIRLYSPMPLAVQLGHAGRKGSCAPPWLGGGQIAPERPDGWRNVAPSPLGFHPEDAAPTALSQADLRTLREDFAAAARRAGEIGLDAVQIHGAHGYLLHQFLSPLSNRRADEYGGALENRLRFPLEVFDAVREAFPAERPVSIRLSATDWVEGGWTLEETLVLCKELEKRGCAALHISTGGLAPQQKIPIGPNYQVPFAKAVKQAVKIPVVAVGLITDFDQAEKILAEGAADLVGVARAMMYDPHWPWHAAAHFGAQITAPPQYHRSAPHGVKNLFKAG